MTLRHRSNRFWLVGLAALAGTFYLTMWIGWAQGWNWLVAVDAAALDASHRIGIEHPGWVMFWDVVCTVFSLLTLRVLTLGLIVYAFIRRGRRVALFLLLSVEGSAVLTWAAKRLAERPRPDTALVDAASTSFPSGHAVGTMVAVLALAVVLAPHIRRSIWSWAIAAGILIVVSVGVGRVALNVHHPSDVLAGWALGYLYFVVTCLPVLRRRRVTGADQIPVAPGRAH